MDDVRRAFSVFTSKDPAFDTQLTDVVEKDEPRSNSPEMQSAFSIEVRDLLRQGAIKVILKEELPDGANELTARFILVI